MSWTDDHDIYDEYDRDSDDGPDIEEITVNRVTHYTEKAVLVNAGPDGGEDVWLPRSQIDEQFTDEELRGLIASGDETTLSIPVWLREEHGL